MRKIIATLALTIALAGAGTVPAMAAGKPHANAPKLPAHAVAPCWGLRCGDPRQGIVPVHHIKIDRNVPCVHLRCGDPKRR